MYLYSRVPDLPLVEGWTFMSEGELDHVVYTTSTAALETKVDYSAGQVHVSKALWTKSA